jgi:drug/metabolite transporter (DMT)-like permease
VVATARLGISLVVFAPWLMRNGITRRLVWRAAGLGAVQFGLMYCCYIAAYRYLPAYGVAFYTIFTPLYVAWLDDLGARRWAWRHTVAAGLAVGGAALVSGQAFGGGDAWLGIALLQVANICFAFGQLGYRRLRRRYAELPETTLLGWMYGGAVLISGLAALALADFDQVAFSGQAWLVLLYLGVLPTGIGFYLWNKGAARVAAGKLAVANNLKVPLAILVSWLVFGESADYGRVLVALAVIVAALFLADWGGAGEGRDPVD